MNILFISIYSEGEKEIPVGLIFSYPMVVDYTYKTNLHVSDCHTSEWSFKALR